MPIQTKVPIESVTQNEFHQVDKLVTGLAFEIHNELGRFLDEPHYRRALGHRCAAAGLSVDREMRMRVSLDDFNKDYFADFLFNRSVIVEAKATSGLTTSNNGQTLNYLFLSGLNHGTMLNFATERVEHRFVSTTLKPETRFRYRVSTESWSPLTASCQSLRDILHRVLAEWGAYLDPLLYRDSLAHFLGAKKHPVEVHSGDICLGLKEIHLIDEDIAFLVTTSTHRPESVFAHLRRFLSHTKLRAIQWVNLDHGEIELRTIQNSGNKFISFRGYKP